MPFRRLDRSIRTSELGLVASETHPHEAEGTAAQVAWNHKPLAYGFPRLVVHPEIVARRLRPVMRCVARDNPRWPVKED
ncbi:hypothetical protein CU103_06435 [Phyllobacterium sophorae]|uniref:Uncharacterized protein n=1 Tax=Phyllobacterium sophorae TaxID=1520277 RepID=A0A2P7BIA2_9HYPH|nr:hypothetical protein CU103_06435 [Phyllobacterium sophorae]